MKRLLELLDSSLFHPDAVVTRFEGKEELSNHFEYFLTIDSPNPSITPSDVIGKPLGLELNRDGDSPRIFHGYISHLWAGDFIASKDSRALPSRIYRIRIVPWSWFMTRAARSFVYLPEKQEKSVQDVLDRLMEHVRNYGHVEPWFDPSGAYILKGRKHEHCVQYRESDYAFFARTLERYGIYYYFRHEPNKHTLVLGDKNHHPTLAESEIDYPHSHGIVSPRSSIIEWHHAYEFVSGKWSQTDYDFKNPSSSLRVEAAKNPGVSLSTNAGYELYDYPNDYVRKSDGREEAHRRQEEEEVRFNTVSGRSSCVTMTPGYVFKLRSHANVPSEAGKSYLLTSVHHQAQQPGRWTSMDQAEHYENQFTCIPKEMQFRPRRETPRPQLSSIQTAVVVGPRGEEIYTDEFGRVKVQFHWDREGRWDENTSCWIRVSQSHAGRGFGGIDIPRVGEEVIVSFLEGDPDRPLITGRVYHQEAMPPFSLPGEKTRSGIKTKTYKGKGFNEMSMDDTPGKEQIRIHGEHNLDAVVKNNETHTIGKDRQKMIGNDETVSIINNQSIKIGNDQVLDVGNNRSTTVHANHMESVKAAQTVSVGADQTIKVGASQNNKITANQSTSIGSKQSTDIGLAKNEMVGAMANELVGFIKTVNVGVAMNTIVGALNSEQTGGVKHIVAGTKFEVVCGASSLTMDSGGKITIKGTNILIDSSGPTKINGAPIDLN